MNTKHLFNGLLAASIAVALIGVASPALAQGGSPWRNEAAKAPMTQNQTPALNQGNGSGGSSAVQGTGAALPAVDPAGLTQAETDALLFMREEEKLARDVYTKLADTSQNAVFTRIAASEQRHMDALGRLISRYRLTDPAKGNAAGVFENAQLQALYDTLIAKGTASPAAAIQVGLDIERLDIADLQNRAATAKHTDVRWVFQQLERGSNNHLRAFTMQAG